MSLNKFIIGQYIPGHSFNGSGPSRPQTKWVYNKDNRNGVNGIHFDLHWKPSIKKYRLCIGVNQVNIAKSKTGVVLDPADVKLLVSTYSLKTGIEGDAVGFEESDRVKFLNRAKAILDFIILKNLRRPQRQTSVIDNRRISCNKNSLSLSRLSTRRSTSPDRWFKKKAMTILHSIDSLDWDLISRAALGFDTTSADYVSEVGESKAHQQATKFDPSYKGCREHVIPCAMILGEAQTLAKAGASVCELADFLKAHLSIVLITYEERENLDQNFKLKVSMPQVWHDEGGWRGGDKFSRLRAAGIALV